MRRWICQCLKTAKYMGPSGYFDADSIQGAKVYVVRTALNRSRRRAVQWLQVDIVVVDGVPVEEDFL